MQLFQNLNRIHGQNICIHADIYMANEQFFKYRWELPTSLALHIDFILGR